MSKGPVEKTIKTKHKGTIGIIGPALNVAKLSRMVVLHANDLGLDDDQYIPEVIAVGINTNDIKFLTDEARLCSDYGCDLIAFANKITGAESFKKALEDELSIPVFGCGAGSIDEQLEILAKNIVDYSIRVDVASIRRPVLSYRSEEDPFIVADNVFVDNLQRLRRLEDRADHGGYPVLKKATGTSGRFVGVLGGSGPLTSADFTCKLAANGVPFVHCSINSAPGRLIFEQGEGPSYIPHYANVINFFNTISSNPIVIPCNTAHKRLEEFCESGGIEKVIDIRTSALDSNKRSNQFILLGTPTTTGVGTKYESDGIYEEYRKKEYPYLRPFIVPDEAQQERVTEAIFLAKAGELGRAKEIIEEVVGQIRERSPRYKDMPAILGCTELPLPFAEMELSLKNFIDPSQLLAERSLMEVYSPSQAPKVTESAVKLAKQEQGKIRSRL